MNEYNRTRRIAVSAVIAAGVMLTLSCHKDSSVDWKSLDNQTVLKNLTTIESAGDAYAKELAAGGVSAAAKQAQTMLMASPGVDTAVISPDSTVWTFFSNGLLVGTGRLYGGDSASSVLHWPTAGEVRACAGGSVIPRFTIVLPFDEELPYTDVAGGVVYRILDSLMLWRERDILGDTVLINDDVTVDAARSLFFGPQLILWSGHGGLVPVRGAGGSISSFVGALLTGQTYDRTAMAESAAGTFLGDLTPTGSDKRCAIFYNDSFQRYEVELLPGFIRKYASFDTFGDPGGFETRTIVYLSCCFSAYGWSGDLVQAFRDKGADLVFGYNWAVSDSWSCRRDTSLFADMSDTCTPLEAWRRGPNTCPVTICGGNAKLGGWGDTLTMLDPIMRFEEGGSKYRSFETGKGPMPTGGYGIGGFMVRQNDSRHSDSTVSRIVSIYLPERGPGHYSTADSGVEVDLGNGSDTEYTAQQGFVGVGCQINVTRWTSEAMFGSFSGTVGYWDDTPYALT